MMRSQDVDLHVFDEVFIACSDSISCNLFIFCCYINDELHTFIIYFAFTTARGMCSHALIDMHIVR